ncbi:pyridoxal 5'-phosphate synthase glutaminase subunit PdxT [Acaricomes phytoseiuli]|uniref:pyridoxal 5'-phosphate synthase glutaminase subunit PdxT n=1 Tax=Acaricomes phytoseiuli TaxID=291968 RepID=UPI000380C0EA|nr:pyridoxal 5'-phosphate synthase glutaminase subunit PdxT [Acaricomes phytoseiuli]MCW1249887.1 pyridoxal 5'-phosphate synthase glutaminase subunit PdxT [Acaricomes phytoseiuli]
MISTTTLTAGVLALQGDTQEHLQVLRACGVMARPVRRASELDGLAGLTIPGGESTAMDRLIRAFELEQPLRDFIRSGKAVYGSCAGMILLADKVLDPALDGSGAPQRTLGGLDIAVRRNAFGRQRESFETAVRFTGISAPQRPVHAVFIRAPWAERVGSGVETLAEVRIEGANRAVAVRSGNLLATSFHPEATGADGVAAEPRVHELFVRMMKQEL